MALPHTVQKQLIKKRIKDLTGKAKINEIYAILDELPNWNTGPYGELRKWLHEQIEHTATRSKIQHQEFFGVKREGHRQFMLVGQPSAGKSSLVKKLCGLQTKVADYAFTTLKPIPGVVTINGAQMQLVDLPGLIAGASDDIGGGKRLLGLVKQTDGIVLLADATKPLSDVAVIMRELKQSNIEKPLIIVLNKIDRSTDWKSRKTVLQQQFPGQPVIAISAESGAGLDQLREVLWKQSRLIRVFPKGTTNPIVLDVGATVVDFADHIHTAMKEKVKTVRVSGSSAKHENQQVSMKHVLADGDVVELVLRR